MAALAVVAALATGCASHLPSPETQAERYAAAVADAESATPGEVVRDLWAVAATTPRLQWEGTPGASRVRVVTWTSWAGYESHLASDCADCIGHPVWVTLVPQVRERCRRFPRPPDALQLRLAQLLGLPPATTYDRFVELWVEPQDLYRPCPDPEVGDRVCLVELRSGAYAVADEYRRWFEGNFATYHTDPPYPWTRLGYTYDWGGRSEVGASELVIRPGATVGVAAIAPTAEYCRRP